MEPRSSCYTIANDEGVKRKHPWTTSCLSSILPPLKNGPKGTPPCRSVPLSGVLATHNLVAWSSYCHDGGIMPSTLDRCRQIKAKIIVPDYRQDHRQSRADRHRRSGETERNCMRRIDTCKILVVLWSPLNEAACWISHIHRLGSSGRSLVGHQNRKKCRNECI